VHESMEGSLWMGVSMLAEPLELRHTSAAFWDPIPQLCQGGGGEIHREGRTAWF